MYNCAFCNKAIGITVDHNGQPIPDTKYYYRNLNKNIFFCDAKCSLVAHETCPEWYILKDNENNN